MYQILTNAKTGIEIDINGVLTDEDGINLSKDIRKAIKAGIKNLTMHINSYGGSVKAAWDIVAALKSGDIHVKAINEGFAISAASVLLAAADEAVAFDYSTAMIHDPLLGGSTLEDTKGKERQLLQKIKDGIMTIYKKRFSPSADISSMMKQETSLNADEQISYGLVDRIIERSEKPKISTNLDTIAIYNLYEEHKHKEQTVKKPISMIEVTNHLSLDEGSTEEQIVDAIKVKETALEELTATNETLSNSITELTDANNAVTNEFNVLLVENFILKNDMQANSEVINNAVEKHGIEVLETIFNFLPTKVVEETVELKNKLTEIVNDVNEELEDVTKDTTNKSVDKIAMANEIFALGSDEAKRNEIKNENPELFNELYNIFLDN